MIESEWNMQKFCDAHTHTHKIHHIQYNVRHANGCMHISLSHTLCISSNKCFNLNLMHVHSVEFANLLLCKMFELLMKSRIQREKIIFVFILFCLKSENKIENNTLVIRCCCRGKKMSCVVWA